MNWAVSSDHLPPTSAARTAQRATFSRQLRVSAFRLASSRYWKLTSRRCTSFGCAIPSQVTNQSRVDRKMCASKEGQSVRQDFQKACVPHIESSHIEISNRHVRRDASSCSPASLCGGVHERVAPSPKHANLCARSSTMAKDVQETTTSASATGQGDGKTSAATEQETKRLRVDQTHTAGRRKTISLRIALPPAATHVWVDSAHPRRPRQVVRPRSAIPK